MIFEKLYIKVNFEQKLMIEYYLFSEFYINFVQITLLQLKF